MVLTEEQKERIRKNRERALKIQRERLEEKKKLESKSKQEIEISQQQKGALHRFIATSDWLRS